MGLPKQFLQTGQIYRIYAEEKLPPRLEYEFLTNSNYNGKDEHAFE